MNRFHVQQVYNEAVDEIRHLTLQRRQLIAEEKTAIKSVRQRRTPTGETMRQILARRLSTHLMIVTRTNGLKYSVIIQYPVQHHPILK